MKIKYILTFLLITILLSGCYSREDKKLIKQYKNQGKINALNYVKKKYGFDVKIKNIKEEVDCNNSWKCMDSTPTGNVIVKMSYNDKLFTVYVDGTKKSIEATDDYQINDIKKDFIDYLKNNIRLELYDYKITLNTESIKELYNNNLNDMAKYIDNIELYYVGKNNLKNLNLNSMNSFLQIYNGNISIINFKNKENCINYKSIEKNDNNDLTIYKESELVVSKNQKKFYKYDNITTYNNKVFVYSPNTDNKYEITTSKLSKLDNYKKLYKDLNYKTIKKITTAYEINRPREILYFYFSKNNLSIKKDDKVFMVYECFIKGEKKHFISSYFSKKEGIKINDIGKFYMEKENLSVCDVNTKITFALIKISY